MLKNKNFENVVIQIFLEEAIKDPNSTFLKYYSKGFKDKIIALKEGDKVELKNYKGDGLILIKGLLEIVKEEQLLTSLEGLKHFRFSEMPEKTILKARKNSLLLILNEAERRFIIFEYPSLVCLFQSSPQ